MVPSTFPSLKLCGSCHAFNFGMSFWKKNLKMGAFIKWFGFRDGWSSAGRAGRLVIGRSLAQIPAPGWAGLPVEVSVSKILTHWTLNCSWCVVGTLHGGLCHQPCYELATCPCPRPEIAGIGSSKNPLQPHKTLRLNSDQIQRCGKNSSEWWWCLTQPQWPLM